VGNHHTTMYGKRLVQLSFIFLVLGVSLSVMPGSILGSSISVWIGTLSGVLSFEVCFRGLGGEMGEGVREEGLGDGSGYRRRGRWTVHRECLRWMRLWGCCGAAMG